MEDFRELGKRLSNWGRWGAEDERGTLNLITPDKLVAAAGLVRKGAVFDLGIRSTTRDHSRAERASTPST